MTPASQTNMTSAGRIAKFVAFAWNWGLILIWATWWGGLNFYALVVVPIGTELIGSVEQGFITQKVTQAHNAITVLFVICLLIEAYRRRHRMLWSTAIALLVITIGLISWHVHLTSMMDFEQQSVPGRFYSEHAVYLWLTAFEWGLGLLIPVWFLSERDGRREPRSL
ncbi:MAG: hypothetical protein JWM11_5442 [Planctomycetaceae bacterium]|nr:hypothetical protein [Planctomycetaceae bacterium]